MFDSLTEFQRMGTRPKVFSLGRSLPSADCPAAIEPARAVIGQKRTITFELSSGRFGRDQLLMTRGL
jgi:hypothetical protein